MSQTQPPAPQRRQVLYEGHVQGVGFRFTVLLIARRYDVAGFVRNLPDGRVELVAEGTPEVLSGLLADVADAMKGYIRRTNVETAPATGEFSGFDLAY